jgi:AcrR family transcriptional regulator
VFAVHGPDAPVSAVAAAAGVGIGTLYRRYPSKAELLQQLCLASMAQQIGAGEAAVDQGDSFADLVAFIRACVSFRAGVFSSLAGTIPVTPEMRAAAVRAHDLLAGLVSRAQEAGALRPDVTSVDIHQLIELFSRRRPDDDGRRDGGDRPDDSRPADQAKAGYQRLLQLATDGLRPAGAALLPGVPVPWSSYASAWSRP